VERKQCRIVLGGENEIALRSKNSVNSQVGDLQNRALVNSLVQAEQFITTHGVVASRIRSLRNGGAHPLYTRAL
jgi:hypothetical protein